jgi:hypothetical protein
LSKTEVLWRVWMLVKDNVDRGIAYPR